MDPDELRAHLRAAAAALPEPSGDARTAVARRVRRQRITTSLMITAAALAVVSAVAVAADALRGDRTIEFTDTPAISPTAVAPPTCGPVAPPEETAGALVAIYLPCGRTDVVARVHRPVADRSLLTLVREVFDCPTPDERRAGRRCAFDGPGQGLVTGAEIDGATARVTLSNAVDGLSSSLRNPRGLLAAIEATVFAAFDAVDRIELSLEESGNPDALCRMVGVRAGCATLTRSTWAARPDGWRPASLIPPEALGTFGGEQPTGPVRVGNVVVRTGGFGSATVHAVTASDGAPRWQHKLSGDTAFVADQQLRDAVLVASQFGSVVALDAASGDRRWTRPVETGQSPGAPAVADGVVYLPASFSFEGDARSPTVTAFDASSGDERWRTTLLPDTELQWAPPTVSDRLVIVADTPDTSRGRAHLHALDRDDGERLWTFEFASREQGFHSEQPFVHDDHVFAVSGGVLYALDPVSGEERWRSRDGSVTHVFGVTQGGVVVEMDARIAVLDTARGDTLPPGSGR